MPVAAAGFAHHRMQTGGDGGGIGPTGGVRHHRILVNIHQPRVRAQIAAYIGFPRQVFITLFLQGTDLIDRQTQLGGHPSLGVGPLLDRHRYEIGDILRESLEHEQNGIAAYRELLALAEGRSILLEEYARRLIGDETKHVGDVQKMLRAPGTPPTA